MGIENIFDFLCGYNKRISWNFSQKGQIYYVLSLPTFNMTPDLMASYMQANNLGDWLGILILIIAIRDAVRKAIALWKSASRKQLPRFICLFIFNTAGILPIIYIFFFSKKNEKQTEATIKNAVHKVEKEASKAFEYAEGSIEHTIAKVENLIKKAPIIEKKPAAKKAPAKKSK